MKKTWCDIEVAIRRLEAPFTVLRFPNIKRGIMIERSTGKEVASTPDEAYSLLIEGAYE